ncbi:excalibur calcium-binding domain-containing protein [Nocardia sp. NEAU-G5]|uniref:Excalibur calcium-binding domain-containing protein n=2 Tax=Nocardia albiluteola TaxID=2842303 RepID=A0ABS6B8P2_9NOCA|nr:excalibur calcium-binding domain-containing protein [Nocardia albiluteola]
MIPAVAAAGLLTLGTVVGGGTALASPGSGAGTGGSSAGGSGFTVNNQGTISGSDTGTQDQRSVYYPNCATVRAEGKAPLYSSQPGYNGLLDPKGTGVACGPDSNTP